MLVEIIARDAVYLLSTNTLKNRGEAIKDPNQTQEQTCSKSKQLWEQIQLICSQNNRFGGIVQDFIRTPDNEIVQAIFRHQLSKFLKEDKTLFKELRELIYRS